MDKAHILQYNKQSISYIEELCTPLFAKYGLTTFAYIRFYDQGIIHICNNQPWLEYYVANDLQMEMQRYIEEAKSIKQNFAVIPRVISRKSSPPKIVSILNFFNIYHGLSIYKKTDNLIEIFNFATHKENDNIWTFYWNETNLLKEFILYFKSKLGFLEVLNQPTTKIILPTKVNIYNSLCLNDSVNENILSKNFIEKGITINGSYLSRREIHCLALISHGLSVKGVASLLGISGRTVECYINSLRLKMGYVSKAQLAEFYWNSEFSGLFMQHMDSRTFRNLH